MASSSSQTVSIGSRELNLSNLGKVLYPNTGFTKAQVIDYYTRITPVLMPHLAGRALTLKRYPNGVDQAFFYEKRCPEYRPTWVNTVPVWSHRSQEEMDYCVVDDPATLVWVANLASIELHTHLARAADTGRPTMMVFDLDPGPPATLLECIPIAFRLRDLLKKAGLVCLAKTSGGKGIHLAIPLNTPVGYEQTKTFSRAIAELLERHDPDHVTSNMRKDLRPGRIFIDWSQNDQHKTTVCVYSLRARERPTVSTPVTWPELKRAADRANPELVTFETDAVLHRIRRKGDLFADVLRLTQKLPQI